MRWLVFSAGLYIAIEALISIFWQDNDKWIGSQLVRGSRIVVGVFIILVSVLTIK